MNRYIPYGKQDIYDEDIDSVVSKIRSDFLTQGPAIDNFERVICEYTGAKYAVAVNSATAGLHIACMALGLKEGDVIWTSPITFVSSANCALFCNAKIDFVDIDINTFNISIDALEEKLIVAEKNNALPQIFIPVHMCGTSADMKKIYNLSKKYNFKIIEDAAHAIGATYENTKVGACQYSDFAVFSFHPVKIITTGEGGVVTTNDKKLYEKLLMLRTHGITRDASKFINQEDGAWYYEMLELSYNYRMTDIQAALGASQFSRLDDFVTKRNKIANDYISLFSNTNIKRQKVLSQNKSSYHLFPILVSKSEHRKDIFNQLRSLGIGVNVHYIPVYLQPYYQKLGFTKGYCLEAEEYYSRAISIPLYHKMTQDDVEYVASNVINLCDKYG